MSGVFRALPATLLVLLLAAALHAKPPPDGFTTSIRHAPYDVRGSTTRELVREMQAKGPAEEGRRFFGRTEWSIRWNYLRERRDGAHVIRSITVAVNITHRLPRRIPTQGERDDLAAEWARFFRALTTHEQGHARNALQHGKALHAKLLAHGPFASARELEEYVRTEGAKCIAETRAADIEYDRRTEHGATQGAMLR